MEEKENNKNKKFPKLCVGAFIFNEKKELFLMKSPAWKNNYTSPGGKIEFGETLVDALKREVKEETNISIKNIKFLGFEEALDLGEKYEKEDKHLILMEYSAELDGKPDIKLNEEARGYKWLKIEEWLDRKDLVFSTRSVIEKLLKHGEGENQEFKEAYAQTLNEKEDAEERYKRALADYQNLLRQNAEDRKGLVKYANENLIIEIIPVYDNLKMSLAHIDEKTENNGWLIGIKHVIRQFKTTLEKAGIEEIKTVGEKFDHNSMEAVGGQGETVVEEIRPGYKLNGKVIVPARVVVG